ncbi:hypothetical protein AOLI_G00200210 [Acnodon oligacanthus]
MTEADLLMENGDSPSQKKIKVLGMIMYYQWFIPNCSSIAKPLFSLTVMLKGKKINRKGSAVYRKLSPGEWSTEHSKSFKQLKSALLVSVVLVHPDFHRPFILSTDASLDGLGTVLSQVPEGETKARPIAFASKALTRAQSNKPAHCLEFLALKWSICDKFSHWLKGHSFTVLTENNPLTYILTKSKLAVCEQRWVAKLAPYNFSIQYIPGSKNVVADALSGQPFIRGFVSQRLVSKPYEALLEEGRPLQRRCGPVHFSFVVVLCLGEALKRSLSLRLKSCPISAPVFMTCYQKSTKARKSSKFLMSEMIVLFQVSCIFLPSLNLLQ